MSGFEQAQRIGDVYSDTVLPVLAERLDSAFPEFGWKRDARGWVATNEEMTHRVLGVRAARVVAHGAAPTGFLIHGGESTLWTAYLSGGSVPKGDSFATIVRELAVRAGVETAPIDRPRPRDRGAELLEDFFRMAQAELSGGLEGAGRSYLEQRGFLPATIDSTGLGVVPPELVTKNGLLAAGYSDLEIAQSGVLADGRWPGRLCGAWRDEHGAIRTIWARSLSESQPSTRYLYLRGHARSGLPPYGVAEVLALPVDQRRELLVVEGLIDVHKLRSDGFGGIAAAGGAQLQAGAVGSLRRRGVESIVLAFDNDEPGRAGTARAVEGLVGLHDVPTFRVLEPTRLGDAKDPDAFVRAHGIDPFRSLVDDAECAIVWRARELVRDVTSETSSRDRRAALGRAGEWLGTLSPRFALEQEDAVRLIAGRCGYSPPAVERAFRARFWQRSGMRRPTAPVLER